MGQEPDELRNEIEHTRERMSDAVEAIGYKANVPSRAKDKVSGALSAAKQRIVGVTGRVKESTPSSGDVKQAAQQRASVAQDNPLGLAIGSVAVGFLAGMLIPSSRVEDDKIGPVADQVKEQAKQTGQEALERGKQVAQEVASTAQDSAQQVSEDVKQTAQQAAQEHGEQVKQSVQQSAQQLREQARP